MSLITWQLINFTSAYNLFMYFRLSKIAHLFLDRKFNHGPILENKPISSLNKYREINDSPWNKNITDDVR